MTNTMEAPSRPEPIDSTRRPAPTWRARAEKAPEARRLPTETVEELEGAGLLRDLQAIDMHALLSIETNREMYGRVLLGLDAPLV